MQYRKLTEIKKLEGNPRIIRDKQAIGSYPEHSGGCVTSIDSDAPGDQLGERGASPTVTLQEIKEGV